VPLLGITMGDPAGIGPEVIAKALLGTALRRVCSPLVIGSSDVMQQTVKKLKLKLSVRVVKGHEPMGRRPGEIAVLDPLERPLTRYQCGVAAPETGAASVAFIKQAVHLAQAGCIDGMVTGPINKEAINMAGCHYPGHTELLADLTHAEESGMMIIGGPLKIMFVTTHVAIKDLPALLTQAKIEKGIRLAHMAMTTLFGVKHPRIGIAALILTRESEDSSATKSCASFHLPPARRRPRGFWPAIQCRRIRYSGRPPEATMMRSSRSITIRD